MIAETQIPPEKKKIEISSEGINEAFPAGDSEMQVAVEEEEDPEAAAARAEAEAQLLAEQA